MKIASIQIMFLPVFRVLSRTALCICLMSGAFPAISQYYILGRGLDDDEVPYAHSTAILTGEDYSSEQICTEQGVFRFENLKAGPYELVVITPYGIRRKKIDLKGSIDITLHIARNILMDEISVVANRAGSNEPVTHDNITAIEIEQLDFGKDLPYLLQQSPSVLVTSDGGTGVGYTGLRIRGTDPTRINVTLNGIPVNDAESHNVFWVDLPDIASSTTDIQIQRGLGWSQPGTGDFGGSVNVNTMGFHYKPYGGLKLGGGSFGTQRGTITLGSGLIKRRFTLDGRGTLIHSDGFIDRAKSDLYSVYGAAGFHYDQNNIRLVIASGDELTYQAWNGVPEQYVFMDDRRTFNTAGTEKSGTPYDNEVDDYHQTPMQLHFDQAVTPFARLTSALFYTKGKGFFEQYKADQALTEYGLSNNPDTSDLVRQLWLDNDFYGFNSTIHFGKPEERYLVIGTGWNKYLGDHFGEVIRVVDDPSFSIPHRYYFDDAEKRDWNLFGRTNMKVTERFSVTLDLQERWIKYRFVAPDGAGKLIDQQVKETFFNPKLGLTYSLGEESSLYGLTGLNHKEPNRDDYVNSTPEDRPSSERLWDNELGWRFKKKNLNIELTGYYMQYKDQLVPTGKLNDVGAYTRVNVDDSHRVGLESSIGFIPAKNLNIGLTFTLSDNRIKSFDEYIDDWSGGPQQVVTHHDTPLSFSPQQMSSLFANYVVISNDKIQLGLTLQGRYVGKQFVDNTGIKASVLDSYGVADAGIEMKFFPKWLEHITLGVRIYNLLDEAYESNGWIYRFRSDDYNPVPDDPYAGAEGGGIYHQKGYFPQAGRHLMAQLSFDF